MSERVQATVTAPAPAPAWAWAWAGRNREPLTRGVTYLCEGWMGMRFGRLRRKRCGNVVPKYAPSMLAAREDLGWKMSCGEGERKGGEGWGVGAQGTLRERSCVCARTRASACVRVRVCVGWVLAISL